ncbi:MAG: hypothetical protein AAGN82_05095 [Myxococcota bacterium]
MRISAPPPRPPTPSLRRAFRGLTGGSLVTLLSNYACSVAQRGHGLYFRCNGLGGLILHGVWALLGGVSMVAMYLLVRAGGDGTMGMVGGAMALSLAFWSVHLGRQRWRRHGQFELDGDRGFIRRYRAGRLVEEVPLAEVTDVGLVPDTTFGVPFGRLPSWIQIRLRSGAVFRVTKGTRLELLPVCDALGAFGLGLAV